MQLTPLRARRRRTIVDSPGSRRDGATERASDLGAIAERIAGLIDGPVTEALVAMLTDLYGDALARVLVTIREAPGGAQIIDRLCDDPLVGGLLVVHDLHPRTLSARVERALASVDEPADRAARVSLDRIEDDVVYVRLDAATGPAARSAIARAIASAAPEISRVCTQFDSAEDRALQA